MDDIPHRRPYLDQMPLYRDAKSPPWLGLSGGGRAIHSGRTHSWQTLIRLFDLGKRQCVIDLLVKHVPLAEIPALLGDEKWVAPSLL